MTRGEISAPVLVCGLFIAGVVTGCTGVGRNPAAGPADAGSDAAEFDAGSIRPDTACADEAESVFEERAELIPPSACAPCKTDPRGTRLSSTGGWDVLLRPVRE